MKLFIFAPLLMILIAANASASALIQKDENLGVIRFISQLNFSGPESSVAIARASTEEISRMWNEAHAKVLYNGRVYRTEFVISYTTGEAPASLLMAFLNSTSCAENYITVKNLEAPGERSFYMVKGRTGTFYTSDDLGRSTTVAHEYGHGLGLKHNPLDQVAAAVPGIMFPRGTRVAPQFQYNPAAASGSAGGTINPVYRHVRADDIADLDLGHVTFIADLGCLGRGLPLPVPLLNVVSENATSLLRTPAEMATAVGAAAGAAGTALETLGQVIDQEN